MRSTEGLRLLIEATRETHAVLQRRRREGQPATEAEDFGIFRAHADTLPEGELRLFCSSPKAAASN